MTTTAQQHVLDGGDLLRDRQVRVTVADGCVAAVDDIDPTGTGRLFAPGLVDLQVNGVGGVDFNAQPLTVDDVHSVSRMLLAAGTTTYLPAVTTNAPDRIVVALRTVAEAAQRQAPEAAAIGGIHLEGPFISPEDGPRGAHDARHVRPPDWDLFSRWQDAAGGLIRIVTLSPEWSDAPRFIERVVDTGVLVAIGHTAAAPEQVRDAVHAGARLSTHLGNGAHLSLPRHHNYLWEQLASDDLYAAVIADGAHLPDAVLTVILRAKRDRAVLVSDASSVTGSAPGRYELASGRRVELTDDGRLVLASNPDLLAGSVRLLPYDVAHLARSGITTLAQAWEMASVRPAALLNLRSAAGLAEKAPADLVSFEWDGDEVSIREVWKDGRQVATAGEAT